MNQPTQSRFVRGARKLAARFAGGSKAFSRVTARLLFCGVPRLLISCVLLIPFYLHVSGVFSIGLFEALEDFGYGVRVRQSVPAEPPAAPVALVFLDQKAIAAEGEWPWPRGKVARLIDKLFDEYEIRTLGFDAQFLRSDDENQLLADALIARDVVLGFSFDSDEREGKLPRPAFPADRARAVEAVAFYEPQRGYSSSMAIFQDEATGGFYDNPYGRNIRLPLIQRYEGRLYESLALATARLADGAQEVQFVCVDGECADGLALKGLMVGDRFVPVDANAAMLVPFRPQESFTRVRASDVLNGSADLDQLKDAVVLFGSMGVPGIKDAVSSPLGDIYGVVIHACLVAGILDGELRYRPAWAPGAEILAILLFVLVLSFGVPRLAPVTEISVTVALAVVTIAINQALFQKADLVLPLAVPLTYLVAVTPMFLLYGFTAETIVLRKLLGRRLAGDVLARGTKQRVLRDMTVLMADVRDYSTYAEDMDPEHLDAATTILWDRTVPLIRKHGGHVVRFTGDEVMAVWGDRRDPDQNHARNAVRAGLAMRAAMPEVREELAAGGYPRMRFGIGINSGRIQASFVGGGTRVQWDLAGDAVNLASRLEGQTKVYGVDCIVGAQTAAAVDEVAFRELDRVQVKSKPKPVAIFEPLGPKAAMGASARLALSRYQLALMLYRAQEWDLATAQFELLRQEAPHPIYAQYLRRIAGFKAHPPDDDWPGIEVALTK